MINIYNPGEFRSMLRNNPHIIEGYIKYLTLLFIYILVS
mgnify:CR=1 FL=1